MHNIIIVMLLILLCIARRWWAFQSGEENDGTGADEPLQLGHYFFSLLFYFYFWRAIFALANDAVAFKFCWYYIDGSLLVILSATWSWSRSSTTWVDLTNLLFMVLEIADLPKWNLNIFFLWKMENCECQRPEQKMIHQNKNFQSYQKSFDMKHTN